MEDPTKIYAIPTSAVSAARSNRNMNGMQSRTNLVDVHTRGTVFKRKDFYKNTTLLLSFCIILLILSLAIVAMYYIRTRKALLYSQHVCTSEECLRSAADLHLSMDERVDPCDDFYEFACGRWGEVHPNHGWYPKFSAFESIDERVSLATQKFLRSNESADEPLPVKQSRLLYKSCMDVEAQDQLGYSVIHKYLGEVGLPDVPRALRPEEEAAVGFDLIDVSVKLKKVFAMDLFVQFQIEANIFNRSNFALYIGAGATEPPLPSIFKKTKKEKHSFLSRTRRSFVHKVPATDEDEDEEEEARKNAEQMEKQRKSALKILKKVIGVVVENATTFEDPLDEQVLEEVAQILYNVTVDLEQIGIGGNSSTDSLDELDYLQIYNFTVDELQNRTDECLTIENLQPLDFWRPYITKLFEDVDESTFDFDADLLYVDPDDFDAICEMLVYLSKTPDSVLEMYAWWSVVGSMIMSTTTEIYEFVEKENGQDAGDVALSSSLACSDLVNSYMPIAISYAIVDKAFMNTTMPKVEHMLGKIKHAFMDRVSDMYWMDSETKRAALDKAREMVSFIGFPEWLLNKTAVELYYSNITITASTYLENMMQFIKKVVPASLQVFKKTNEKQWRAEPTEVNAYNYFRDNSINIPMAILTFPLYHLGLEMLNYGSFGTLLGHELTHGFDDTGRYFDKDGNFRQWWTQETAEVFKIKAGCFVEQYADFHVESIDMNVDGELTLGENIADNGGLHHAYLAYQNYVKRNGKENHLPGFELYTNEQMFFIGFASLWCETRSEEQLAFQMIADEHSPNKFRVLGVLQNSHEFAKAFKCRKGTNMNPRRARCIIW